MNLKRYTGYSPTRVTKDAKYTVTAYGDVRLEYQESSRIRMMLTTSDHPDLVEMVNAIKNEINPGRDGGAFYINEFHHVLVPDGQGGKCYYAGNYTRDLEFGDDQLLVTARAPASLRPGDDWPGPHVGIPYVLNAGATDIRFENLIDERRWETILLTDFHDPVAVRLLTRRLADVKGTSGGRFFINERGEFFAPVGVAGSWTYKYIGPIGDDVWFHAPDGYDR